MPVVSSLPTIASSDLCSLTLASSTGRANSSTTFTFSEFAFAFVAGSSRTSTNAADFCWLFRVLSMYMGWSIAISYRTFSETLNSTFPSMALSLLLISAPSFINLTLAFPIGWPVAESFSKSIIFPIAFVKSVMLAGNVALACSSFNSVFPSYSAYFPEASYVTR